MEYYVYENWQAGPRKAVIHRSTCAFCNSGRGRAGGYDPTHARWHGSFGTIDEAREYARALPLVVVQKECRCV